ncbi:hypothetical protein PM082_023239 [Marasmius tenuissimus]|nr:hypothetical protein PM082_023239 [Marasmius tenuissimus]
MSYNSAASTLSSLPPSCLLPGATKLKRISSRLPKTSTSAIINDKIRAKRQERYAKEMDLERKERKAVIGEKKRIFWEETAHTEYMQNTLGELRNLEKNINVYLSNSGSEYLKRIYHEYLAWTQSAVRQNQPSPLDLSYKTFNSMLDAVGKIGNSVLNEYGAGKEWKECQRLTRRIRYLIQCIDNLEMADLEQQSGSARTEISVLEDRYSRGKLQFQDSATGQWLDCLHCKVYISVLDSVFI